MPRTDNALDVLHGATYSSSLNMCSSRWHVPMHEPDTDNAAFTILDGLYEFTVVSFGLFSAPTTFKRMMGTVLQFSLVHLLLSP